MEYRFKGHLVEELYKDYMIKEGMKACMNCGVCTAVCPAAEFYKYNPKNIVNIVARKNEDDLEDLLKSDQIWYCGECMSCVTRCPRANAPGLVIMALRKLSMRSGLYMQSEKGRQFKEMTTDAGVDVVSFGGTKNGLMIGESVVFLNHELAKDYKYRRKQGLQLCSKMRFLAVQFEAYFKDELWRRNAEHSNKMAQLLYNKVKDIPQVKVVYPVQVNGVFAQLPRTVWTVLQKQYFFYDWDLDKDVVRWMCSFDTTEEDINNFVDALKKLV